MRYDAHEEFIAPARPSAALWRLGVGFTLAVVGYVALSRLYFQVVYGISATEKTLLYSELLRGTTPTAMYLLLFSFAFMFAAVGASVRLVHRRPVRSLLGPWSRAIPQFRSVLSVLVLLGLVIFLLPPWDMGYQFVANMPPGKWMILLPFSLLAVLVQVSAEEIVFRGYVQQQLAARFKSPLIWMALPSLVFALGHYVPDAAGENAIIIALWAGIFGIFMADLTARSGSLGPAIAVHFWNNVAAILIVSLPDDLSGLALYLTPFSMSDAAAMRAWLPVDFALMLVSWLAARLALRK